VTAISGSESSSPEPLVVRERLYVFDPELRADRHLVRLLDSDIPAAVLRGAKPPARRPAVSGPSVVIPVVGVIAAAIGVIEGQVGWAIAAVVGTVVALVGVTAVDATGDAPHDRWMAVHAALARTRRLAPGSDSDDLIAAVNRLRTAAAGLPADLSAGVALRRNTVLWGLVAGIRSVRRLKEQLEPLKENQAAKAAKAARVSAEADRAVAALRDSTSWADVEAGVASVYAERDRSSHVVALRMAKAQVAAVEGKLATESAAVAVLRQELDQLVEAVEAAASGERRGAEALAALLARAGTGRSTAGSDPAPLPPPPSPESTPASADTGAPADGSTGAPVAGAPSPVTAPTD
jgi:hypothetical protein